MLTIKLVRLVAFEQMQFVLDGSSICQRGQYLELLTGPWKTGDRVRSKRFSDINRLHAYLQKLLDGGWIVREDYDYLHMASLSITTWSYMANDLVKGVSLDA